MKLTRRTKIIWRVRNLEQSTALIEAASIGVGRVELPMNEALIGCVFGLALGSLFAAVLVLLAY